MRPIPQRKEALVSAHDADAMVATIIFIALIIGFIIYEFFIDKD